MTAILYLRSTKDWIHCDSSKLDNRIADVLLIESWSRNVNTDWFQYRHQVKEIAQSNWPIEKMFVPNCCSSCGQTSIRGFIDSLGDDDWVLPTDDDDWFHPRIEDLMPTDGDFITWSVVQNQTAYRFGLEPFKPVIGGEVPSNGYAIRGSAIKKLGSRIAFEVLDRHHHAMPIVKNYKLDISATSQTLSCYNKHPGSVSILWGPIDWDTVFPKNKRPKIALEWITPWVHSLDKVVNDLELRSIKLA